MWPVFDGPVSLVVVYQLQQVSNYNPTNVARAIPTDYFSLPYKYLPLLVWGVEAHKITLPGIDHSAGPDQGMAGVTQDRAVGDKVPLPSMVDGYRVSGGGEVFLENIGVHTRQSGQGCWEDLKDPSAGCLSQGPQEGGRCTRKWVGKSCPQKHFPSGGGGCLSH